MLGCWILYFQSQRLRLQSLHKVSQNEHICESSWVLLRTIISGGCPFKNMFSIQVHGTGGEHSGDPHPGGPAAGHGQPRGGGSPAGTSYSCCCCCVLIGQWTYACCANIWLVMCCCALMSDWSPCLCVLMSDWSCSAVHWCLIGHMLVRTDVWLDTCLCVLMSDWTHACVC